MYQALRIASPLLTLIAMAAALMAADALGRRMGFAGGGLVTVGFFIIAAVPLVLLKFALQQKAINRALRQYSESLNGDNQMQVERKHRALLSLLRLRRGHYSKDFALIQEAVFRHMKGQFEESLQILELIQREGLARNLLPTYLFNLAWTKVQTGKIDEGVELVHQAMDLEAVKTSTEQQSLHYGILGAALVLTNRPDEALPMISPILENNPQAVNRSCAAHYMGLAFKALGRSDEARASFERSVNEAPQSLWGQRSRAALMNSHFAS